MKAFAYSNANYAWCTQSTHVSFVFRRLGRGERLKPPLEKKNTTKHRTRNNDVVYSCTRRLVVIIAGVVNKYGARARRNLHYSCAAGVN